MNIKYRIISQPISSLLRYFNGHAVVQLGDKRIAKLTPLTLTEFGINPEQGHPTETIAARLTQMREHLLKSHATLTRDGNNLFVVGLYAGPVDVLQVSEENVNEIERHARIGQPLTNPMLMVFKFLARNRSNRALRTYHDRINAAIVDGEEDPAGLVTMPDGPLNLIASQL